MVGPNKQILKDMVDKKPPTQPEDAGLMPEYTKGICHDGAAILKDGKMITIEQVLEELNTRTPSPSHLKEIAELKESCKEFEEIIAGLVETGVYYNRPTNEKTVANLLQERNKLIVAYVNSLKLVYNEIYLHPESSYDFVEAADVLDEAKKLLSGIDFLLKHKSRGKS